jgi:diguanylate cyclase (GGDEF)-like protein/PAS domain S-box-containing protein
LTGAGQYRDLFENAVDFVYTHDLAGNFTSVNKAAEQITGYSRGEILRMNVRELLDRESYETALEAIREALGGNPCTRFEVALLARDGRRVSLEVGTRLVFRQGLPVGVQGIAHDITERKRAEALERDRNLVLELVASNEPLESVLDRLVRLVEAQCSGVSCAVLLRRGQRWKVGAAPSLPAAFGGLFEGPDPSLVSSAYEGLLLCEPGLRHVDVATDPALRIQRDLLLTAGLKACWAAPIASGANLLGALLLYCRTQQEAGARERQLLDTARRLAVVVIEHKQLTDQLAYQAHHDALTGLPNRLMFDQQLEQCLEEARRHNWLLAVLFIDLDRFKQINDTLGHPTGDLVLEQVARRLEGCLRKSDTLARLGGDEFALVLPELNDSPDALRVAQKLLDGLQEPFHVEPHEMFLTASVGISLYPRDGTDAPTLERNADTAMYRAKNRGRNHVEFFTPELGLAALERMEIENALRKALECGELQLYYQPQVEAGNRLAGLEALLVWNHPKLGPTSPRQFIPVAEESGMIVPIGSWALAEACRQNVAWQKAGGARVKVAVNVSATQFCRADFVETVAQTLAQSGLDPALLELELTEGVVMRDLEESARQMDRLRALGVSIAIDDFGTGYSSLSYLRRLPIDSLKIDRSFLKEMDRDANTMPLVQAIVTLAHGLGLTVVAEGVETRHQLEGLREVGCDRFQGFLLGGPAPPEGIEPLLLEKGSVLT